MLLFLSPVITGEVYLPDIFVRQPHDVGAVDHDDVHFKVIQFWGDDFYTTRLIHNTRDGSAIIRELDVDDSKHWTCDLQIDDAAHMLIIRFPRDRRYWEYWWDTKRLVRHQETGPIQLYPAL